MQNNPFDELARCLARLLEQISSLEQNIREIEENPNTSRIIGCAVITGDSGPDTKNPQIELAHEVIDTDDILYLTIQFPSSISPAPCVEIGENELDVSAGKYYTSISLPHRVDRAQSSYTVMNGIIDARLLKERHIAEK